MKHFTMKEFEVSATATAKKIDNSIPASLQPHIIELVDTVLDPLREAWGSGIHVNSGYRCPALNKAVGGSQTSAHSHAYAADLRPANGKMPEFKKFVYEWLQKNTNIKFDQFIDETSGSSSWVHIGVRNGAGKQRRQFLKFRNGKYTVYA